jgi:NAD(P)-dependent dehydrogenase (short-subunit alcohol dehydrogenase family)
MMGRLEHKVAIVLGASAERGTGWAIAEELARRGAKVAVAARRKDRLDTLAERIGGAAFACDIANERDVIAMLDGVRDRFGEIDIAVNSSGQRMRNLIKDLDAEQINTALAVNFLGPFYFVKHAAARMHDQGSIILISSYSAVQPVLPHAAYACAKAATDCLVRYAAIEYAPRGIRVNSILPGPIKSEMVEAAFARPGVEAALAREIPLGRVGVPQDYADAVCWLAGPAFVTGLNIPVLGGGQMTRMPRPDELP